MARPMAAKCSLEVPRHKFLQSREQRLFKITYGQSGTLVLSGYLFQQAMLP